MDIWFITRSDFLKINDVFPISLLHSKQTLTIVIQPIGSNLIYLKSQNDLAKLEGLVITFFEANKSDRNILDQLRIRLSFCICNHQNPLPFGIGHFL